MDNLQKLCLRTKLQQENSRFGEMALAIRFGERKILFECVTIFLQKTMNRLRVVIGD